MDGQQENQQPQNNEGAAASTPAAGGDAGDGQHINIKVKSQVSLFNSSTQFSPFLHLLPSEICKGPTFEFANLA